MFTKAVTISAAVIASLVSFNASALVINNIEIKGSDAIWLAGRTDLVIPPAGVNWIGGLARHPVTPELIQETRPPEFAVAAGDVIKVRDPAVGGISFFRGFGPPLYGPDGNPGNSNLTSFGGISSYIGTQGALAGVFLDDNVPNGAAPAGLNFSPSGLGTNFLSLTPDLGQVFFIGDGVTDSNEFQEFIAPGGATRLFLGITDGFGFVGPPGAYDDNDGSYRISIGINETPVPAPGIFGLLLLGLAGIGFRSKLRV